MAIIKGLNASFLHPQNGMTFKDMKAIQKVANKLNEVIIFRSTGPWAKRWLEKGYPSKNFHTKGKSSDWGPQAGLVPYNGIYSKVGANAEKAKDGTEANDKGIESNFVIKTVLKLTYDLIKKQCTKKAGGRVAIMSEIISKDTTLWCVGKSSSGTNPLTKLSSTKMDIDPACDLIFIAIRSGDNKGVFFRAFYDRPSKLYTIKVYNPDAKNLALIGNDIDSLFKNDPTGQFAEPLYVMASNENGAECPISKKPLPMAGDYDLLLVSYSFTKSTEKTSMPIRKKGIRLNTTTDKTTTDEYKTIIQPDFVFPANMPMDVVLEKNLDTASNFTKAKNYKEYQAYCYHENRTMELGNPKPQKSSDIPMLSVTAYQDMQQAELWMQYPELRMQYPKLTDSIQGPIIPYHIPQTIGNKEHLDMGNVTPRVLRAINTLNEAMGATGDKEALRRVHHNAESYRNVIFGAMKKSDMTSKQLIEKDGYGDGFPLTVFQPNAFLTGTTYSDVFTLETYLEFIAYLNALEKAEYIVPKNWAWEAPLQPSEQKLHIARQESIGQKLNIKDGKRLILSPI